MSEAIREAQRLLGVVPDGIFGRESLAALKNKLRPVEVDPNDELLIEELLRDEGFVSHVYQDSLGYWTIGIGRLVDKRKGGGITRAEADYLKLNDIAEVKADLDREAPWWRSLDPVRRRVMQNATFQLGVGWISEFKNTIAAIRNKQWDKAADGMLASKWAKQTPSRVKRLAQMMRTGSAT